MAAGVIACNQDDERSDTDTQSIGDLIRSEGEAPWFAFEFFPPKTPIGRINLRERIQEFKKHGPLYIDFTWGAGGSTSDTTLELASEAQNRFGLLTNMHLTCTNMPITKLEVALNEAKRSGIKNILALRGDPALVPEKSEDSPFKCALDLIKFIRERHGDFFCLGVAGYPEGHPDTIRKVLANVSLSRTERDRAVRCPDGSLCVCSDNDFRKELEYLKSKVDAGASYIITQMFYDFQTFLSFVKQCRAFGITVPIIPGIMCFSTYAGFMRMLNFCKSRLPSGMQEEIEAIKDDPSAVEQYAIRWGTKVCKKLLEHGFNGLHFYTLNSLKVAVPILEALDLIVS